MSVPGPAQRVTPFVTVVTTIAALSMAVLGVWMRIDPASFARFANFPVHVHFLHDAGVFQIGIGLMMLCALRWSDLPTVVLGGFVFTNTFHVVNHVLDRDLGGNDSDWWTLGSLSVLAGAALVARLRQLGRAAQRSAEHADGR
jgi:hypothetical protein